MRPRRLLSDVNYFFRRVDVRHRVLVEGDAMAPMFRDGDNASVDPDVTAADACFVGVRDPRSGPTVIRWLGREAAQAAYLDNLEALIDEAARETESARHEPASSRFGHAL